MNFLTFLGFALVVWGLGRWRISCKEQKRLLEITEETQKLGLDFDPAPCAGLPAMNSARQSEILNRGHDRSSRNIIRKKTSSGIEVTVFDYAYFPDDSSQRGRLAGISQTVTILGGRTIHLPDLEIGASCSLTRFTEESGCWKFDFPGVPEFSKKFLFRGKDQAAIQERLCRQLVDLLIEFYPIHIEADDGYLLFYWDAELVAPKEIQKVLRLAERILEILVKHR